MNNGWPYLAIDGEDRNLLTHTRFSARLVASARPSDATPTLNTSGGPPLRFRNVRFVRYN